MFHPGREAGSVQYFTVLGASDPARQPAPPSKSKPRPKISSGSRARSSASEGVKAAISAAAVGVRGKDGLECPRSPMLLRPACFGDPRSSAQGAGALSTASAASRLIDSEIS